MRTPGIGGFIRSSMGQFAKQKLPSYVSRAIFSVVPKAPSQYRYSMAPPTPQINAVLKRTLSIDNSPDQRMLITLIENRDWTHLERYLEGGVPELLSSVLVMALPLARGIYSDLENQKKIIFSLLGNIKDPALKKEVGQRLIESAPHSFLFESLALLEIEKIGDNKWKENCSLLLARRLLQSQADLLSDRDPERNLPELKKTIQVFALLGQIQDRKKAETDLESMTQRAYLYMVQPSPASLRQICFCIGCLQSTFVRREIMTFLLKDVKYNSYEITSFLNFLHPFEDKDFLPELMQIAREQNLGHQHLLYTEFFSHVGDVHLCEEVAEQYLKANPKNMITLLEGLSYNKDQGSLKSIIKRKLSQYPLDQKARTQILEFWLKIDPNGKRIESILSENEPLRKELLLHAVEHMNEKIQKLDKILSMLKMEKVENLSEIQQALSQPRTFLLTTPIETFQCQRYSPTVLTVTNFISKEECEYLYKKYQVEMQKSSAESHLNSFKANQADLLQFCVHYSRNQNPRDPVIDKLLNKLDAFLSGLNSSGIIDQYPGKINLNKDLEQLNVIQYEKNVGQFDPHFDNETTLTDHYNMRNRIATALIYLNTVEEGGATVFVDSNISIQPEMGKLLFFYNYDPQLKNPNEGNASSGSFNSSRYKPWYPNPINRHAGQIPISNDKIIITAFFMEHFNSSALTYPNRNSRQSLPYPIMP